MNVLIFVIYVQKRKIGKFQVWPMLLSSLVFIFSSPKFLITKLLSFLFHGPLPFFFTPKHLFCLYHHKTYWTMSVDNLGFKICLLGISNFMVTLTVFPWCKPKWSGDEFNNQSQIFTRFLEWLYGPWCKQPLSGHITSLSGQHTNFNMSTYI